MEGGNKSETCSGECPRSTSEKNPANESQKEKVTINGRDLSDENIGELAQLYGVNPKAGVYWYDTLSGLYGALGYPAFGFMLTGHDFAPLSKSASNGNSGVFINGRELPEEERQVWSNIIGSQIQPASYWLDENGNAGYVGNPTPLVNLYAAFQSSNSGSNASLGDNFWSTRFSAGNSNSDNSQGYVSVPGYGPVGYGF